MLKQILTLLFFVAIPQFAFAAGGMSCAQIREKAVATPKHKATCNMIEHTLGLNRGTTITTYSCGAAKYTLHTEEDFSCTVTKGIK